MPSPPSNQNIIFYYRSESNPDKLEKIQVQFNIPIHLHSETRIIYVDQCIFKLLQQARITIPTEHLDRWRRLWQRTSPPSSSESQDKPLHVFQQKVINKEITEQIQYKPLKEETSPMQYFVPSMLRNGLLKCHSSISEYQKIKCLQNLQRAICNHWKKLRVAEWTGRPIFVGQSFESAESTGYLTIHWDFTLRQLIKYIDDNINFIAK